MIVIVNTCKHNKDPTDKKFGDCISEILMNLGAEDSFNSESDAVEHN